VEGPAFQAIPSLRFLSTYKRNFRLRRLVLDADEMLDANGAEALAKAAQQPKPAAYDVCRWNYVLETHSHSGEHGALRNPGLLPSPAPIRRMSKASTPDSFAVIRRSISKGRCTRRSCIGCRNSSFLSPQLRSSSITLVIRKTRRRTALGRMKCITRSVCEPGRRENLL
jgi:hypothetical protein